MVIDLVVGGRNQEGGGWLCSEAAIRPPIGGDGGEIKERDVLADLVSERREVRELGKGLGDGKRWAACSAGQPCRDCGGCSRRRLFLAEAAGTPRLSRRRRRRRPERERERGVGGSGSDNPAKGLADEIPTKAAGESVH